MAGFGKLLGENGTTAELTRKRITALVALLSVLPLGCYGDRPTFANTDAGAGSMSSMRGYGDAASDASSDPATDEFVMDASVGALHDAFDSSPFDSTIDGDVGDSAVGEGAVNSWTDAAALPPDAEAGTSNDVDASDSAATSHGLTRTMDDEGIGGDASLGATGELGTSIDSWESRSNTIESTQLTESSGQGQLTSSTTTSEATHATTGTSSGSNASNGTEFKLTAPWSAKDTCTPEANDTCDNIETENRATMIGGDNVMPTFEWSEGPEGTTGYALVFQDLSFMQQGKPAVHWAMWGIPSDVVTVGPNSIPEAATEAAGFSAAAEWFGSGACGNVYELSVYALSAAPTSTTAAAIRDELEANTGDIVSARDYARVSPKDPCD